MVSQPFKIVLYCSSFLHFLPACTEPHVNSTRPSPPHYSFLLWSSHWVSGARRHLVVTTNYLQSAATIATSLFFLVWMCLDTMYHMMLNMWVSRYNLYHMIFVSTINKNQRGESLPNFLILAHILCIFL